MIPFWQNRPSERLHGGQAIGFQKQDNRTCADRELPAQVLQWEPRLTREAADTPRLVGERASQPAHDASEPKMLRHRHDHRYDQIGHGLDFGSNSGTALPWSRNPEVPRGFEIGSWVPV